MKRFFAGLLVVMFLFLFAGCSATNGESDELPEATPFVTDASIFISDKLLDSDDSTAKITVSSGAGFIPMPFLLYNDGDANIRFYSTLGNGLDSIPMELMNIVGVEKAEAWLNDYASIDCESVEVSELATLYSFMIYFDVPDEVIRDYLVRQREICVEHDIGMEYMTDEDIEVLLSRDDKAVAARFAREPVIVIGSKIYSPKWVYYHSAEDYKAAGISRIQISERIKYYKEFGFNDEARKYFKNKLSLYLDREVDFEPTTEKPAPKPETEPVGDEPTDWDNWNDEVQKFIRTEKVCGICVGTPAGEVERILGKPIEIIDESDHPDGVLETWRYSKENAWVCMETIDGKKTVRSFCLGEMSVTDSGIKIGSTRQEVIEAYKNKNLSVSLDDVPYEDWGTVSLYDDYSLVIGHWKHGGMYFHFENDILTDIVVTSGTCI